MEDQRELAKEQLRKVGLWGILSSLKRNADVERATLAKHHGMKVEDIPGFMQEVPFGNVTTINQIAPEVKPSSISKWVAVALAAGTIGFGSSFLLNSPIPPKPETPPPVNAVIEWEIIPDDAGSRISGLRSETSRISSEASTVIGSSSGRVVSD